MQDEKLEAVTDPAVLFAFHARRYVQVVRISTVTVQRVPLEFKLSTTTAKAIRQTRRSPHTVLQPTCSVIPHDTVWHLCLHAKLCTYESKSLSLAHHAPYITEPLGGDSLRS